MARNPGELVQLLFNKLKRTYRIRKPKDDRQAAAEAIHVASSASVTDSYPDDEEEAIDDGG